MRPLVREQAALDFHSCLIDLCDARMASRIERRATHALLPVPDIMNEQKAWRNIPAVVREAFVTVSTAFGDMAKAQRRIEARLDALEAAEQNTSTALDRRVHNLGQKLEEAAQQEAQATSRSVTDLRQTVEPMQESFQNLKMAIESLSDRLSMIDSRVSRCVDRDSLSDLVDGDTLDRTIATRVSAVDFERRLQQYCTQEDLHRLESSTTQSARKQ